MASNSPVSLKKIAKELGVSHTLISRVISGRMGTTRVGEATRKAILKRVKELDYQPNRFALALKSGQKGVVGVFLHHVGTKGSAISENFIKEISRLLSDLNLRLWLRFFERDEEFHAACTKKLQSEMDGLIIGGISHPDLIKSIKEIERGGLPVVCAFHELTDTRGVTNFEVDHEMQSYLATKHLAEIGCLKIAHFNSNKSRLKGYRRALKEVGLRIDRRLVVDTEKFSYSSGLSGIQKLHEKEVKFDGLVAESDAQAAASIHWLVCSGVPVSLLPRIVGIDNSPISEHSLLSLTTVTAEMEATADAVVHALLQKMDGVEVKSRLLPPRLIIRKSTVA